jgi:hypothetical protein
LATSVAVAVVDGAVASVQAAAAVMISVHTIVLPRRAAIREDIRLYTFSVFLGVLLVSRTTERLSFPTTREMRETLMLVIRHLTARDG